MARRRKTESLGDGLAGRAFTKRGPKVELDFLLPTRGPSAGAEPVVEPAPTSLDAPRAPEPAPFLTPAAYGPAPDAPIFEAPASEVDDPVDVPDLTVSQGGSRLGLAILELDEPTLELWLVEAAPTPTPRPTPPPQPTPQPTIVWPALLLPVPPPAPTWSPPRWTPAAPPHPTRWRDRALRHVERFVAKVLRAVF